MTAVNRAWERASGGNERALGRQSGFTLIEIMIVVVIIGILAGLMGVMVTGRSQQAKMTAAMADIMTIKVAIADYEMENGKVPSSLTDLVSGARHYLDRETVPQDPWGGDYKVYWKGDLVKIRSAGPDGAFDTEDDVVNQ